MIKTFPKFIVRLYLKKIARTEKLLGYKLTFPQIPPTWINSWAVFDLTKNWEKFGLDVTGTDYFTMGSLAGNVSTRYDPKAKQYQSWLGGYLVKFSDDRVWAIQDHLNLAVVDQVDWLRHFRDPNPICDFPSSAFEEAGPVEISGYKGRLYVGGGISHTDIGKGSQSRWTNFLMAFMATIFNLTNPGTKLTSRNFIPSSTLNSYENVFLKCYVIILELGNDVQAVLYGNGAIFKDSDGKEVDTFELLKDEMLAAMKGIVIAKV
jgi:hypothetical protein